eukprot:Rmarinus@m.13033
MKRFCTLLVRYCGCCMRDTGDIEDDREFTMSERASKAERQSLLMMSDEDEPAVLTDEQALEMVSRGFQDRFRVPGQDQMSQRLRKYLDPMAQHFVDETGETELTQMCHSTEIDSSHIPENEAETRVQTHDLLDSEPFVNQHALELQSRADRMWEESDGFIPGDNSARADPSSSQTPDVVLENPAIPESPSDYETGADTKLPSTLDIDLDSADVADAEAELAAFSAEIGMGDSGVSQSSNRDPYSSTYGDSIGATGQNTMLYDDENIFS